MCALGSSEPAASVAARAMTPGVNQGICITAQQCARLDRSALRDAGPRHGKSLRHLLNRRSNLILLWVRGEVRCFAKHFSESDQDSMSGLSLELLSCSSFLSTSQEVESGGRPKRCALPLALETEEAGRSCSMDINSFLAFRETDVDMVGIWGMRHRVVSSRCGSSAPA